MARRPALSPAAVAIERLAKLANAGTGAARMDRDTRKLLAEWRAVQEPDVVRRWAGELHADVVAGLAAAEEQAEDADPSDPGALKHLTATVDGLRAAGNALVEEIATL